MSYSTLKAPFDGVVTQRNVDPGDLVRNSQAASESSRAPLFEISHVAKVRLRVAIPENESPLARVGNAVSLKLRSLPDRDFEGKISRLSRRLDQSTQTMMIEVDLDNSEGLLIPGMYGEATVDLQETPNALMIAATAVKFDKTGNSSVYVVENGAIRIVPVVTGCDNGRQIQILSGIDESAQIAADRIGRFADGQKVRVEGSWSNCRFHPFCFCAFLRPILTEILPQVGTKDAKTLRPGRHFCLHFLLPFSRPIMRSVRYGERTSLSIV
jgi:HlyD family secretion protein